MKHRDEQWLRQKYHGEGLSCSEIADQCSVCSQTVYRNLKKNDIDTRSQGTSEFGSKKYHQLEWLQKKYHDEGLSYSEIGELCGVTKHTIYESAKKVGLDAEGDTQYKNKKWLHKQYIIENKSLKDISDDCSVTKSCISNWCNKYGFITNENKKKNSKYKNEDWLREKYIENNLDYTEISNRCGVSPTTIGNHIRKFGIKKEKKYHQKSWLENQYIKKEKTLSDIANECDVARQTIANWCETHSIKIQYPEGEEHPQFKEDGGKYPENKGGTWEKQRREALERANHRCENPACSEDKESLGKNPDVHHIVPYRFHKQYDVNALSNLVVLCRSCHTDTEPSHEVYQ